MLKITSNKSFIYMEKAWRSDHRQKSNFGGGEGQNCVKTSKNWGGDGQNCVKTPQKFGAFSMYELNYFF